jgi:phosphohistidine phosphatase SixA
MHRLWVGFACALIALALVELRHSPVAAEGSSNTKVWLVRHAEKQQEKNGVWVLSKAGHVRAQDLADLLKKEGVKAVIATSEVRTVQTADKVAKLPVTPIQPVIIQIKQPKHAEQVAKAIQAAEPNILAVGHSDTVLDVIAALRGQKGQKKTVEVFNRIFVLELDAQKNVVSCSETTYGAPKMQRKTKTC